jgi:hypothetical protein
VPLNEGRGIYLLRGLASNEPGQGVTWSAPEVVFDAVAAGWSNLSSPRLVFDGTGGLNMSWIQRSLPPNSESLGLTASRAAGLASESSGQLTTGWSEPEEVVRGIILWSEMVSTPANGGSLHQAWQQVSAGQEVLFHQVSTDDGLTWSEPARVTGLENTKGPAGMAVGADGALNLVQAVPRLGAGQPGGQANAANYAIQRWIWQAASGWQAAENQPVPGMLQATAVALAAGSKGVLGAWLNGLEVPPLDSTPEPSISGSAGQASHGLFYMGRSLSGSLPAEATSIPQTPVPGEETALPTTPEGEELSLTPAAGSETPLPSPTPTLNLNTEPPGIFEDFLSGRLSGLLLSVLPVLILVGVVIIVSLRKLLRK